MKRRRNQNDWDWRMLEKAEYWMRGGVLEDTPPISWTCQIWFNYRWDAGIEEMRRLTTNEECTDRFVGKRWIKSAGKGEDLGGGKMVTETWRDFGKD